jgi:hypothetical protein
MAKLNIPTLDIVANTINCTNANGLALGNVTNRRRIQSVDANTFNILGDTNGFADLGFGTLLFATSGPGTLVNGQVWFDGTNLKLRTGGVTKTVTVT